MDGRKLNSNEVGIGTHAEDMAHWHSCLGGGDENISNSYVGRLFPIESAR